MVAQKKHLAAKSFVIKIVGPEGYARVFDLLEGQYSVGSNKDADILLPSKFIKGPYATLSLTSCGNLEVIKIADSKTYKTQYEKNEWIKCEDFYIQVPVIPENNSVIDSDSKNKTHLAVAKTDVGATLPPALTSVVKTKPASIPAPISAKVQTSNAAKVPVAKKSSTKFDESGFAVSLGVPIEQNVERFKDYIEVNDKSIRTFLPNRKKARSQVLEVIYMSYGNIVNFEILPLQKRYVTHLYSYVPDDLKKLMPEERDWISWQGGFPVFTVPHGWNQMKTNQNNVYSKNADFVIHKGVNQLVIRQAQGLPGFILWLTWPGRKEFLTFIKIASLFFLPFMILSLFTLTKKVEEQVVEEEVIIVKAEVIPTPEPTAIPTPEVAKVEPTAAPTVKPTPEPRVAELPKPKEKPKPKVVQKVEPPKRLVVTKGPVKTGGTVPANPRAAQEAAARAQAQKLAVTKAKLSSSLGFISSGRGLLSVDVPDQNNKFAGQRGLAGMKDTVGKNFLANVTGKNIAGSAGGPINTTGSRNIASGPVVSDGEVYGSNKVLAKVSVAGLHSAGGSGSFGSIGAMSTSGNIDQDAVRRAIEKYMSKIRYCYEKALLSKPSMAGALRVEWKVNPGGRASGVKVVQSSLNDASLHGCVSNVIATIPFPNPKGGPASVGYPFDFKAFN